MVSLISATLSAGAIVGIAIAAIVVLFNLILIIRTACNKGAPVAKQALEPAPIDKDAAVQHLREAVRISTISMVDQFIDNKAPFIEYREWISKSYPEIAKVAERTIIKDYSLIYKIPGTDPSLKPGLFLSHIDVVPATPDGWEHDPFSGDLTEDGYIYGRGSQDMKSHMICVLEAVEYNLKLGKRFPRTIYLCFGHDEEPPASIIGASSICKYLKDQGVEAEFVIDEGGTVIDGKLLGIPHTVALIGATEKGVGDFEVVVHKAGGHASNPNPPTACGVLADVIKKIETKPMKSTWTYLSKEMFKSLSPYCNPLFKFFFTNRDVFSPLLKFVLSVAAPMTNALIRTTFAPTILVGSDARNTIPKTTIVNVNYRMITGNTHEDVMNHLNKILKKEIKKGWVEIRDVDCCEPSAEADVHCFAFEGIQKSIKETFNDVVVAPYPFIAASDARFYTPLTKNVFRFDPFIYGLDDQARIHGINERLHVDQLARGVQFFIRCLENTCNK